MMLTAKWWERIYEFVGYLAMLLLVALGVGGVLAYQFVVAWWTGAQC